MKHKLRNLVSFLRLLKLVQYSKYFALRQHANLTALKYLRILK